MQGPIPPRVLPALPRLQAPQPPPRRLQPLADTLGYSPWSQALQGPSGLCDVGQGPSSLASTGSWGQAGPSLGAGQLVGASRRKQQPSRDQKPGRLIAAEKPEQTGRRAEESVWCWAGPVGQCWWLRHENAGTAGGWGGFQAAVPLGSLRSALAACIWDRVGMGVTVSTNPPKAMLSFVLG